MASNDRAADRARLKKKIRATGWEPLEQRALMATGPADVLVFDDLNGDGILDPNEPGIAGVTVTLTGGEDDPNNIDLCDTPGTPITPRTAVTDADGVVTFEDVADGCYRVAIGNLPGGRQATSATPGQFGGEAAGSNLFVDMIGFNPDRFAEGGLVGTFGAAGGSGQGNGSLAGYVFFDANHNGVRDPAFDYGIAGATVVLTGSDNQGNAINRRTTTARDGLYQFDNLPAGVYQLREIQPRLFVDGRDAAGTLGGRVSNDLISNIRVNAGNRGENYNFGELSSRRCRLHQSVIAARALARREGRLGQVDSNGNPILPTLAHRRGPLISRFVPTLAGV